MPHLDTGASAVGRGAPWRGWPWWDPGRLSRGGRPEGRGQGPAVHGAARYDVGACGLRVLCFFSC